MKSPNIPGYEILSQAGKGGMATVWKARQTSLDRIVALKLLNSEQFKDSEHIDRFRAEAQAAAKLQHTGLCQIYDAGESDGHVYYVMEFIEGFSLGTLLGRKKRLPEKQSIMIAYGVATVLKAIWDKHKVVHCDIKPDNIMVDNDGRIRIADFGLARFFGSLSANIDSDYIAGTPNYASPEQARGMDDLDCRTDMYSLGATLYHIVTGVMPFADAEADGAMEKQISDYIEDPQTLYPELSIGTAWLIERFMIKNRMLRYKNWDEAIQDIEAVRDDRLQTFHLPPAGQSTVLRSEEREAASRSRQNQANAIPHKEKAAAKPDKPSFSPKAAPKQKPKPKLAPMHASHGLQGKRRTIKASSLADTAAAAAAAAAAATAPKQKGELTGALVQTVLLAVIVALAYWGVLTGRISSVGQQPSDESQRPGILSGSPRANNPPPAIGTPHTGNNMPTHTTIPSPPEQFVRQSPPREPEHQTTRTSWTDSRYETGMRALREADQAYQQFLMSRDRAVLNRVEPLCRQAVDNFEAVRNTAPTSARIEERIRQANQLMFNARRSM